MLTRGASLLSFHAACLPASAVSCAAAHYVTDTHIDVLLCSSSSSSNKTTARPICSAPRAATAPDQPSLLVPHRCVSPADGPGVQPLRQILHSLQLAAAGRKRGSRHHASSNSQRPRIVQVLLQVHARHDTAVALTAAVQCSDK